MHIFYSLSFGVPIVFHLLSQNILSTFDQVIINQLMGESQAGIYSLGYKVGMILSVFIVAILKAWTPVLYEKINEKKYKEIDVLASKYCLAVSLVALVLILFSKEIVMILATEDYFQIIPVIPVIVIGYLFFFYYSMYVGYAFYYKKTKLISVFTIIAGVANIALNYWLIPLYGYQVAAWTTLLSYLILFTLHYTNSRFNINAERITNLKVFIVPFLFTIAITIIGNQLDFFESDLIHFLVRGLLFTVSLMVFYVYFRKQIAVM